MKIYETFRELEDEQPDIYEHISTFVSKEDLDQPPWAVLGGDLFIVETREEYEAMLKEHEFFDVAELVMEGKWFNFFIANNNAGGPSYYVPPQFVQPSDYEGRL